MSTTILTPPGLGTMVWLHSLKTLRLNGQRALVCQRDAISDGPDDRCAVELLEPPVEGRKVVSVQLRNLSLSPLAYFCIREAPEQGGLGVFATQDIPAGKAHRVIHVDSPHTCALLLLVVGLSQLPLLQVFHVNNTILSRIYSMVASNINGSAHTTDDYLSGQDDS